jgi:hypothetical protein
MFKAYFAHNNFCPGKVRLTCPLLLSRHEKDLKPVCQKQFCGTVMICCGCGGGSDFGKVLVPAPAPVPVPASVLDPDNIKHSFPTTK